jgi:hypothetical protein
MLKEKMKGGITMQQGKSCQPPAMASIRLTEMASSAG